MVRNGYRELDASEIVATADRLQRRVQERFPESGLSRVAAEVAAVAREATGRVEELGRPRWDLRAANLVLTATIVAILGGFIVRLEASRHTLESVSGFIGVLEPALGSVVFIGAFILFLWNLEVRWKRSRALAAIHELRSLAHVVDMHQLAKNPEKVVLDGPDTASSPALELSAFELGRYLDYCSEILGVLSKVAAVYAARFVDSISLEAVDQIEVLTTGLSRKIWQKRTVLRRTVGDARPREPERDLAARRVMSWDRTQTVTDFQGVEGSD